MRQLGLIALAAAAVACHGSAPSQDAPPANSPTAVTSEPAPAATPAPAPEPAASVISPAASAAPGLGTKTYDATATRIEVAVGQSFVVALPANTTTPMEWQLDTPGANLEAGERKYTDSPPAGCVPCAGYGGTDAFTFVGKAAGKSQLHFKYVHLRKANAKPEREVTIAVTVDD